MENRIFLFLRGTSFLIGMIQKIKRKIFGEKKLRFVPVTAAFLNSEAYEEMMTRHLPYPGVYDLHEAQNYTRNFTYRHHEANHLLGAFRWRGIYKHRHLILDLVLREGAQVVDLGGAAGPLGLGAQVVDFLPVDALGHQVRFRYLNELPEPVDVLFSSHTLEHIPELHNIMREIQKALVPGGHLMLHLPAFHCERWRVGTHQNKLYNDHQHTFGLKGTDHPEGLINYLDIDELVGQYFDLEMAEYCGDDSIFILAKNRTP